MCDYIVFNNPCMDVLLLIYTLSPQDGTEVIKNVHVYAGDNSSLMRQHVCVAKLLASQSPADVPAQYFSLFIACPYYMYKKFIMPRVISLVGIIVFIPVQCT